MSTTPTTPTEVPRDRMCSTNGPEPSDDDNTCCECAAEERKQ